MYDPDLCYRLSRSGWFDGLQQPQAVGTRNWDMGALCGCRCACATVVMDPFQGSRLPSNFVLSLPFPGGGMISQIGLLEQRLLGVNGYTNRHSPLPTVTLINNKGVSWRWSVIWCLICLYTSGVLEEHVQGVFVRLRRPSWSVTSLYAHSLSGVSSLSVSLGDIHHPWRVAPVAHRQGGLQRPRKVYFLRRLQ